MIRFDCPRSISRLWSPKENPTRCARDLQPIGASKIHRRDHVMLCSGLTDQLGTTGRRELIPDDPAPQIFIGGIAYGVTFPAT
jgi:hypothetical protein